MTLPQLLSDEFQGKIPDYEMDQKSQEILFQALKRHAQLKTAKQQLLESLDKKISELNQEIEYDAAQQADAQITPAAELVARVAGELGCVGPSSAEILKEMLKMEAQLIKNSEELDGQRKQKEELLKSRQILEQIDEFVNAKELEIQKACEKIETLKNETVRFQSQSEHLDAKIAVSLAKVDTVEQK